MKREEIVVLSGFSLKPELFTKVLGKRATLIDYLPMGGMEELWEALTPHANAPVAIGWSLGGMLLVKAVDEGIIRPQHLILIGTPFQFVADSIIACATPKSEFEKFARDWKNQANSIQEKFLYLISYSSGKQREISKLLAGHIDNNPHPYWLSVLENYSCAHVNFSTFPNGVIVHGKGDRLVDKRQANLWITHGWEVKIWPTEGGHAPFLENPNLLHEIIESIC